MSGASSLSDADLHGLVDGHIDPDRRANVLRRAAASKRDRALIEAWQDQNDLIRAAFAGVEREPLPRSLDLRTPPELRVVPLAGPTIGSVAAKPVRWRSLAATTATLAVMVAGLAGSWYVAGLPSSDTVRLAGRASNEERALANRTVAALAFSETDAPSSAAIVEPPPTATIPDLSSAGFTFIGAQTRGVSPRSVIFLYRNALDERVAIGAARVAGNDGVPAERDGGFTLRARNVAFAIYGTVSSERLHGIASSLSTGTSLD